MFSGQNLSKVFFTDWQQPHHKIELFENISFLADSVPVYWTSEWQKDTKKDRFTNFLPEEEFKSCRTVTEG